MSNTLDNIVFKSSTDNCLSLWFKNEPKPNHEPTFDLYSIIKSGWRTPLRDEVFIVVREFELTNKESQESIPPKSSVEATYLTMQELLELFGQDLEDTFIHWYSRSC